MLKYKKILSGIIQDKTNWTDLKPESSKYNIDNREEGIKDTSAGKIFEVFTKYYFLTSPEVDGLYSDVWLYDEIPLSTKKKLDLGRVEYGIDLLLKTVNDEYIAVQCKFKNDETSKLNWSSDKISNLFAYCPKADGYIIFSNCSNLDKVSSTRQGNFTFYSIVNLLEAEPSVFANISLLLNDSQPKEKEFFVPLSHQQIAIDECLQWFTEGGESRGQLILPCGAGKTFTALWIKEALHSHKTLVLVPSLALLRQIKNEWSKQRKTKYQYLCVCSETDIDKDSADSIVSHTYEISGNVTTTPSKIHSFLNQDLGEKVIFSTYQSLPAIIEAIEGTEINFDFIFCDEAHKTAGISKGVFGLVHDNEKVPAKRRLYATATPRIVKESVKKKLGDDLKYTHDMNDPETFGEEFYRMTFKDAIDEDILTDYKIVAIGVNDLQLAEYLRERRFVNNDVSIDEIANNYALESVMNKYSASHAITFHSRVKLAKEFASRHHSLYEKTTSFSVDGTQPTSVRGQILNEFRTSDKATVSNARCLTEGVDIPAIDLVYFSDPKNSKVDIIQAIGRALRKKEGKKLGYIVVPIYHTDNDEVEDSISKGSFKNLLQVIRSLCDQDERLQDEINSIAFGKSGKGSRRIDVVSSFDEEIDCLHLIGFEDKLRDSLFDQILAKTSNSWDVWFLELKKFLETNNAYPEHNKEANHSKEERLYKWVAQQRFKRNNDLLQKIEIQKLNSINFPWWISSLPRWIAKAKELAGFIKSNGRYPKKGSEDKEEKRLFTLFHKFKSSYRKNKLSPEQIELLDELDIDYKGTRKTNQESYIDLAGFIKRNGRYPKKGSEDKEEKRLYNVFHNLKVSYRNNKLSPERIELLDELNIDYSNYRGFREKIKKLAGFIKSNGRYPKKDIEDKDEKRLYNYLKKLRARYKNNKLSPEQIELLDELDIDYKGTQKTYQESYIDLAGFFKSNGRYPKSGSEDQEEERLYRLFLELKSRYRNNKLSPEQIELLDKLNIQYKSK